MKLVGTSERELPMSERRVRRTIAVLDGVGAVLSAGGSIAEVRYHLSVSQEFIIVTGRTGVQEMPGAQEVHGSLTPPPGQSLPMAGAMLTLLMEDGGEIDFTISSMSAGEYYIEGSGALRDARRTL
jgi:hypothetical protein